jgi:hypothetical protein
MYGGHVALVFGGVVGQPEHEGGLHGRLEIALIRSTQRFETRGNTKEIISGQRRDKSNLSHQKLDDRLKQQTQCC